MPKIPWRNNDHPCKHTKSSEIFIVLKFPTRHDLLIDTLRVVFCLVMDTVTIALPNRPVVTVHRGWTPSKRRGKVSKISKSVSAVDQKRFPTRGFSKLSPKGDSLAANSPGGTHRIRGIVPTTGSRQTSKQIEFTNNSAEPLHTKGAAVRELVRSHVMKEVARKRR